ncbi:MULTISPECIES: hypothetical protein [Micromonospora]|uniref:Uncharacterized protein n=1 Tax=Micromonospora haikouensis TaxID=686309 RepID=A0A0D0WV83_9ACTN|nr:MULTISPECIES: hypothetical protein [Micromonospora]KIR62931.1 hypothetical protein TK50_18555 [Micromonospora haikouensis]
MFLVFAVVATGLLLVWRTWDVELLEYAWFQLLVFLVVAAPLVAMRFWGEGALPPDEATPGRRRPRGQREKPRRSGRRPGRRR